jgi:hypothetical protein
MCLAGIFPTLTSLKFYIKIIHNPIPLTTKYDKARTIVITPEIIIEKNVIKKIGASIRSVLANHVKGKAAIHIVIKKNT